MSSPPRRGRQDSGGNQQPRPPRPPPGPPPSAARRKREYVPCPFCPQVSETKICHFFPHTVYYPFFVHQVTENTDADKRKHYSSNHSVLLFKCKICNSDYTSEDRFRLFDHLKHEHGKADKAEEELLAQDIVVPHDIRRIYCTACIKDGKRTEWMCQDVLDIEQDLHEHREEAHAGTDTLGEIIRLGCR